MYGFNELAVELFDNTFSKIDHELPVDPNLPSVSSWWSDVRSLPQPAPDVWVSKCVAPDGRKTIVLYGDLGNIVVTSPTLRHSGTYVTLQSPIFQECLINGNLGFQELYWLLVTPGTSRAQLMSKGILDNIPKTGHVETREAMTP